MNPNSLHSFGYANGNPLSFVDPFGEASRKVYFRQEIEALPREVREAVLAQIDPILAKADYLGDLSKLSDEEVLAGICGNLDAACDESGAEWLWEQGRRKFGPGLQAFADRVSGSPAADAVRAIRAKAGEIDESLRDTATGTYRQALGPTASAIASSNMRPADAAPQVLAQTQAMSRKLGDATVDFGEEAARTAVETLVAGTLIKQGTKAAEAALGRLRNVGTSVWESTAGLRYGPGSAQGNRVLHVLEHARDIPGRAGRHGVFDAGRQGALEAIDEAYLKAKAGGTGVAVAQQGSRTIYTVDMGRRVGFVGGQAGAAAGNPAAQHVRLVLEGNSVISSFPVVP